MMSEIIAHAFPHDRATLRAVYMLMTNLHFWGEFKCRDYFGDAIGRPLSDTEWELCIKKERGRHILS